MESPLSPIDGKAITFDAQTAADDTAVKAEIEKALDNKYTVTVNGKDITFKQKAGSETDKDGMNISIDGTAKVVTPKATGVAAKEATVSQGKANLQVGANAGQTMTIEIGDMRASALGLVSANGKGLSVLNSEDANAAVGGNMPGMM